MRFHVGQVAPPARVEEVAEVAQGEAGGQEGEAAIQASFPVTANGAELVGEDAALQLVELLTAVRDGGTTIEVDSALLTRRLGWPPALVAERLVDAKGRLLVWGIRVGGQPGPCFADIELTVQGARLLRKAVRVPSDG